MVVSYLIVIGILALGCMVQIAWAVVPTLRRRTTARWLRQQGLPVAAGLEGAIEHARAGRSLAQGTGGLLGLGLGALLLLGPAVVGLPQVRFWLLIATSLAGMAVGLGAYLFRSALPAPTGTTRVAHGTDQTVPTLIGAALLRLARVTVGLGIGSALFVVAFPAGPAAGLPGALRHAVLVGLVVLLVVWLAAEVLAARLARRPQPAGSAAELAWRDVLRAELVRDLYALPGTLALFLAILGVLQQDSSGGALPLSLALVPLGLTYLILVALVGQALLRAGVTPPTRRWRKVLAVDPGASAR